MKKLFVVLIVAIACMSLSSFTIDDGDRGIIVVKEAEGDYIYLTDVKGWTSATESDIYSIYYKEGNGERVYYLKDIYYREIHDNHFFNSPVCNDFRKNYQYCSDGMYFNCNLPGRGEEIVDGYRFYIQVKGWTSATDFEIYDIFYKEGNGERVYYLKDIYYREIHDNHFFNSPVCNDFRKNYQYCSDGMYFNCNLPGRGEEVVDGYRFHIQVKGWTSATDFEIYDIFYKEGNGERVYYLKDIYYCEIHDNDLYNNPVCSDFRKNYQYYSNENYFNCNLPGRR